MPREQINFPGPFKPQYDNSSEMAIHGESWPEPELNVSWNKDGDCASGRVQISIDLPVDYVRHLAKCIEDDETGLHPSAIGAFTPALSRDDINRMIRVLRRARDQAHGRDE